jgi:predicted nuclease of predicted toxin-antitoxin system
MKALNSSLPNENPGGRELRWSLMNALAAAGHEVKPIVRTQLGMSDDAIFALAQSEGWTLLTYDQGFGLMAERAKQRPPAILLIRLRDLTAKTRARIVVDAISSLGPNAVGHVTVIEPHQVRSRPFKD